MGGVGLVFDDGVGWLRVDRVGWARYWAIGQDGIGQYLPWTCISLDQKPSERQSLGSIASGGSGLDVLEGLLD